MAHVLKGLLRPLFSPVRSRTPVVTALFYASQRRSLTNSEAVAALRPFYFAVHPDLFSQHPQQRIVNEESLKRLHEALFAQQNGFSLPLQPDLHLTFFIKGQDGPELGEEFRKVQLALNTRQGIQNTIVQILKECRLPMGHISETVQRASILYGEIPQGWTDEDEEQLRIFWKRKHERQKTNGADKSPRGLREWIAKLSEEAAGRQQAYSALLTEVETSIESLKKQTGIAEVRWESDWTLSHCRGAILALKRVLGLSLTSPSVGGIVPALRKKSVRFGHGGTFISMDGSFHFGCDDIPEEWLRLLRMSSAIRPNGLLNEVRSWEDKLSKALGGVKISCSPATPALQQLGWVRSLVERLDKAKFEPSVYTGPGLVVVVKSESDGYFLGSDGTIHIPHNCTTDTLKAFLASNTPQAKHLRVQAANTLANLESAKEKCIEVFSLADLTWDPVLNPEDTIDCLDRLLDAFGEKSKRDFLKDKRLHFSVRKDYSVMSDGRISLPVDWSVTD